VQMLGVPRRLLEDEGAVSEAVARAMARAALERSDAHVALAVTGFAGPAGPDDRPGRVHFAVATRAGETHVRREYGDAGRGPIRVACLEEALRLLYGALGD
jgi:nicotinamide-nucleotide amidase